MSVSIWCGFKTLKPGINIASRFLCIQSLRSAFFASIVLMWPSKTSKHSTINSTSSLGQIYYLVASSHLKTSTLLHKVFVRGAQISYTVPRCVATIALKSASEEEVCLFLPAVRIQKPIIRTLCLWNLFLRSIHWHSSPVAQNHVLWYHVKAAIWFDVLLWASLTDSNTVTIFIELFFALEILYEDAMFVDNCF